MVIRVLTQRSKKMADLTKRQSNISHICKNLLQWCLVDLFHHPIARQTPVSMQELELGIPQTTSHWLPVRFGPKRKILGANTMLQKSLESILSTTFVWSKISSQWILTKLCTVDANSGKKAMFFIYIKNSIWCWSMVTGQDEKINLVESRTIKLWKIYPFNIVYLRFQA